VETQQNSDTTYRLYDYGRPRELHVEQGLRAVKERTHAGKVKTKRADETSEELVMSRCFAVTRYHLLNPDTSSSIGNASEPTNRSVQILVGLSGCGSVEAEKCEPVKLGAGIAVVIPASIPKVTVRPTPQLQMLSMYLPSLSADSHPKTSPGTFTGPAEGT
jgi:mannose-6-phosphate isomerase